jgi:putative membrane protein
MMFFPILLVILLFMYFSDSHGGRRRYDDYREDRGRASDILDRRFAEGDISEEEYLRRRSMLRER